ncbi:MAG: glycosyltransferase [Acetobacteraceae bacterium]
MPDAVLPAHELLKPAGEALAAWAVFDPAWYLAAYPDARADLGETAPQAAVLEFYLEHGQRRGHSPSVWFDEAWYRDMYPDVVDAVRDGRVQSGFDAYCRGEYRMRSPHWLFSDPLYRICSPDLSEEVLAAGGNLNFYDHFLKTGAREGRIGHLLFDPATYRAQLDAGDAEAADAIGCHLHYLSHLAADRPEPATSICFDAVWYLLRYKEVAAAVAAGAFLGALHHYLANPTPSAFDPLPEFSEAWYLRQYGDIHGVVQARARRNGYEHFLLHGAGELRSPGPTIDLGYYVRTHEAVRAEIADGRVANGFLHYLTVGRRLGLAPLPAAPLPPGPPAVTEQQAAVLHGLRAEAMLAGAARAVLDFTGETPAVSVIMLLRDRFALTLTTLASLRASYRGDIELILVDAGSSDDTRRIGRFVRGARVLRFDVALDFNRAANAALNCVTTDAVLLLDSAVELAPGALDAALGRLLGDPGIGAVGGKLMRAHGRLEAAGCMVWGDGTLLAYQCDADPLAPEANFVRDVDFCSAQFLLLRADIARQVEGFDDGLPAGLAADADLGRRIAAAGARVVYDPAALVTRLTATTADAPPDTAEDDAPAAALLRRHGTVPRPRGSAEPRAQIFARTTETARRVLFIDDTIPLRALGSGFVRSNDLIQVMTLLGYRVTVFPLNPVPSGPATIYADMPDTAEVMHDRSADALEALLDERRGYYDAIWVARTHNLDRIAPLLRPIAAGTRGPRIVLDTEAVVALRQAMLAALKGTPFDTGAALAQEFANAALCHRVVAVNAQEAGTLRGCGLANVAVVGHWREAQPSPRSFIDRGGMLFLGAIHEDDSPNRDALDWFVRDVLPLVEQTLGWETRLTVAGFAAPGVSLQAYRDHPRITLRGPVDDLLPLYNAHRIVVAPTRYAAGVPYKVHEAASYGVPVAGTTLLCAQLGWQDGREMLALDPADPAAFAKGIVALYRDAALWQTLRDNALARILTENGRANYETAVRQVLED